MNVIEFKQPGATCDMVLQEAIGKLDICVLVGRSETGELYVAGSSDNIAEMCLLLNIALSDFVQSAGGEVE